MTRLLVLVAMMIWTLPAGAATFAIDWQGSLTTILTGPGGSVETTLPASGSFSFAPLGVSDLTGYKGTTLTDAAPDFADRFVAGETIIGITDDACCLFEINRSGYLYIEDGVPFEEERAVFAKVWLDGEALHPIPLPGAAALLLIGLTAFGALCRRDPTR